MLNTAFPAFVNPWTEFLSCSTLHSQIFPVCESLQLNSTQAQHCIHRSSPRVWILATEFLSRSTLHSQIKTLPDNVSVSILVTNPLLNNKGLSLFPRTVYWFFWVYPFFTFWFFCFPLFTFWFRAVDSRCRCQLFSASRIVSFPVVSWP